MDKEFALAVKSAILNPGIAKKSWEQLINEIGFENLSNSTQRVLPKIFKNLESETDVSAYEKLKGAYKYNWTKNSRLLFSFLPILNALNEQSIDYRILKGAALNLLSDNVGERTMGDIDLLIVATDLPKISNLFEKNGFQKKFDTHCINAERVEFDTEICFLTPEKFEVDVHLVEKTYPQLLYRKIMKTKPNLAQFQDQQVKLPSYELALIHTVYHGNKSVAATDLIQTYLDCNQLIELVELKNLNNIAKELNFSSVLDNSLNDLNLLREENPAHAKRKSRLKIFTSSYYLWVLKNKFLNSSDFFTIKKARAISKKEIAAVRKNFKGRKLWYIFWLSLGKPRPFERIIFVLFGGFLRNPEGYPVLGDSFVGFNAADQNWFTTNLTALDSHDWRFKIKVPQNSKLATIELIADEFKNWNWLIFVNGKLFGTTTQVDHGTYVIRYPFPTTSLEISMRSPSHVCEFCEHGIADLYVRVHT